MAAKDYVIEEGKPFIYDPKLTINLLDARERTAIRAKELAVAAQNLRKFFLSTQAWARFRDKYVLELVFDETLNKWRLRIRVGVDSWLLMLQEDHTPEDVRQMAENYLTEIMTQLKAESEYEQYKNHKRSLEIGESRCQCGQYVLANLQLKALEAKVKDDKRFYVQARAEKIREILVMPFPGRNAHYNNGEIISQQIFWEEIFRIIGLLRSKCRCENPLGNYVSLNFGQYESAQKENCHAHCHVSLSVEATEHFRTVDALKDAYLHGQYTYWEKDVKFLTETLQKLT
mgnify:CR=1 FL=1